jgi:sigma-E factor negative regulatory protein RseB
MDGADIQYSSITWMKLISVCRLIVASTAVLGASVAHSQTPAADGNAPASAAQAAPPRGISEWLMRMHEASRRRAYIGTLVVSSDGNMASSRIWHVCDGEQQIERVETLTGVPRSTFRRDDEVITFSPQSKVAVMENREALGMFPNLLKSADTAIEQFYTVRQTGSERVAGFESDVLQIEPRDNLRFAYRVWSEKKSGLVVKLETLDGQGHVLEQVAFSELQLDAPVSMSKLSKMMAATEGYKLESPNIVKTTATAQGWQLKKPVPGFTAMSCYLRPAGDESTLQWVFSDGLASVSLFIEAYERRRHGPEGVMVMGATHTLARHLTDTGGEWWLTAVGEVPVQTLQAFAQGLERKK